MEKGHNAQRHCRGAECLHQDDKKGRDQIRCCICVIWHHIDCVSVKKNEMDLIWSCFECRNIVPLLKSLHSEITELKCNQQHMTDELSKIAELREEENKLRLKAEEELKIVKFQLTDLASQLNKQNDELREQLGNQKSCIHDPQASSSNNENAGETPPTSSLTDSAPPVPSLLLGTSLLRNINPGKLENWEIIAKGGAKVEKLTQDLNDIPENKRYKEIVVVAGSIDLESKEIAEIAADYQALSVIASAKCEKLSFSSVLPRTDKKYREKAKALNEKLKAVCENDGFNFIDNDPTFLMLNGNTNEAFLVNDGIHLSKMGLDQLLRNCNVLNKGSAFTHVNYPKFEGSNTMLFKGHKHPLSNFYEVSLNIKGRQFRSSEAAYQHAKAEAMGDFNAANKIVNARTALSAMRIAEKIETDAQWLQRKVQVMDSIIQEKVRVCAETRNTLMESGTKEIIEDTSHEFWGRGKDGKGQNKLGKLWMDLRQKLRENPNYLNGNRQAKQPWNRHQPKRWATREQQPRCFQCGEAGHGIHQCKKEGPVSCWSCNLTGHKRKHCNYYARQSRPFRRHYEDY